MSARKKAKTAGRKPQAKTAAEIGSDDATFSKEDDEILLRRKEVARATGIKQPWRNPDEVLPGRGFTARQLRMRYARVHARQCGPERRAAAEAAAEAERRAREPKGPLWQAPSGPEGAALDDPGQSSRDLNAMHGLEHTSVGDKIIRYAWDAALEAQPWVGSARRLGAEEGVLDRHVALAYRKLMSSKSLQPADDESRDSESVTGGSWPEKSASAQPFHEMREEGFLWRVADEAVDRAAYDGLRSKLEDHPDVDGFSTGFVEGPDGVRYKFLVSTLGLAPRDFAATFGFNSMSCLSEPERDAASTSRRACPSSTRVEGLQSASARRSPSGPWPWTAPRPKWEARKSEGGLLIVKDGNAPRVAAYLDASAARRAADAAIAYPKIVREAAIVEAIDRREATARAADRAKRRLMRCQGCGEASRVKCSCHRHFREYDPLGPEYGLQPDMFLSIRTSFGDSLVRWKRGEPRQGLQIRCEEIDSFKTWSPDRRRGAIEDLKRALPHMEQLERETPARRRGAISDEELRGAPAAFEAMDAERDSGVPEAYPRGVELWAAAPRRASRAAMPALCWFPGARRGPACLPGAR